MVEDNHIDMEKINDLLKKGIITKSEYDYLLSMRANEDANSQDALLQKSQSSEGFLKGFVSFFLTILSMIGVLCGTCIPYLMSMGVFAQFDIIYPVLSILWLGYPLWLFGRRAKKKNDKGMMAAVIFMLIIFVSILFSLIVPLM